MNKDIGGGNAGAEVFEKEEQVRKEVRGEEAVGKSEGTKIDLDSLPVCQNASVV